MRWIVIGSLVGLFSMAACVSDDVQPVASSESGDTNTAMPGDSTGATAPPTMPLSGTSVGSSGTVDDSTSGDATSGGTTTGDTTTGDTTTGDTTGTSTGSTTSDESTSTGLGTTDGTSTGDTDGVSFIIITDGPLTECDLFDQDCPDGEKCTSYAIGGGSWNAVGCFPVDRDPVAVGDVCEVEGSAASGVDNCPLGAMCWDVDSETNVGTCAAICSGSLDNPVCDDPATECAIANSNTLALCLPTCSALLQDCPGDDEGCYAVGDAFLCAPDVSGDEGGPGDPCEFINTCEPGLFCVDAGGFGPGCFGGSCCTPFCTVDDPTECPLATQECVPYYADDAPPGLENLGTCLAPV